MSENLSNLDGIFKYSYPSRKGFKKVGKFGKNDMTEEIGEGEQIGMPFDKKEESTEKKKTGFKALLKNKKGKKK